MVLANKPIEVFVPIRPEVLLLLMGNWLHWVFYGITVFFH